MKPSDAVSDEVDRLFPTEQLSPKAAAERDMKEIMERHGPALRAALRATLPTPAPCERPDTLEILTENGKLRERCKALEAARYGHERIAGGLVTAAKDGCVGAINATSVARYAERRAAEALAAGGGE